MSGVVATLGCSIVSFDGRQQTTPSGKPSTRRAQRRARSCSSYEEAERRSGIVLDSATFYRRLAIDDGLEPYGTDAICRAERDAAFFHTTLVVEQADRHANVAKQQCRSFGRVHHRQCVDRLLCGWRQTARASWRWTCDPRLPCLTVNQSFAMKTDNVLLLVTAP